MAARRPADNSTPRGNISPEQFHREVTDGRAAPVYYLFGSEDYRVVEAEKVVAGLFVGPEQADHAVRRLNARQHPLRDILDALQSLPLLGGRRVITIAEAQSLRPDQFEPLAAVLRQPDPDRLVLLTSPSARLPKKDSAFLRNVLSVAVIVQFPPLTAAEAATLVDRRIDQNQLRLDPVARERLLTLVGQRKGAIEQEMKKLATYAGGNPISADEVSHLTSDWTDTAAMSLARAILQQDRARALMFLQQSLQQGVGHGTLIWQVGNYLTDMLLIRLGQTPSARWGENAQTRRQDAPRFRPDQLEQAIVAVAKAERQLRHSPLSDEFLLEALVVTLFEESDVGTGRFSAAGSNPGRTSGAGSR